MPANKKIAIFDFCGTIYKYQSPDKYADFVAKDTGRTRFLQLICNILARTEKYSGLPHKKVKLYKIKGTSKDELESKAIAFVNTFLLNYLIDVTVKELDKYIEDESFDVVIASAGYSIYLSYFCKIKKIPYFVATDIEVIDNVATGKIAGADCYAENKITKLTALLNVQDYDLKNSVCFSDSMSDKPIFDLTGNNYFVKNDKDVYNIIKIK